MSTGDERYVVVCPKCHQPVSDDRATCAGCGTRLAPLEGPPCSRDTAKLLGRVVNGKYKVLSVLGEGGMGVVYKVRHLILQRRNLFALKILHPKISNDQHFRTRFLREVEVAMELTHENIIQIRDFGLTEDSRLFFTMDHFEGESLRTLIRKEGRMAQERAVGILRQLVKAMCEAHRQGIVHRDLKPDNILVRRLSEGGDEVKILDFGIAKMLDSGDGTDHGVTRGGIVGSPRYMSPEQVAGDPVDHRSDLYSLGVIFFEMLTGTPPFVAKTAQAVLTAQLSARVPELEEACPGLQVAPRLEDLLMSLLEKNPNKRPATPRDVLEVLDGASTLLLPLSQRPGRGMARSVAPLVVAVLAFAIGWMSLYGPPERFGWASQWGGDGAAAGSNGSVEPPSGGGNGMGTSSETPSGTDASSSPSANTVDPSPPSPGSDVPVRLRCQICGQTFAEGELSGNTHHDLPLEKL